MEEIFGAKEWCGLLEETRRALSTLRADDLEQLAARAESVFNANPCLESSKHAGPEFFPADLAQLTRERRLLSDLILATDRNRKVMQRLQRGQGGQSQAEGTEQRWER